MMMTTRGFMLGMATAVLGLRAAPPVVAQASSHRLARWAELDIDPAQLDRFKAEAQVLSEAVLRTEPGVAVYHAVSEAQNASRIHMLEIYDDARAYQTHLQQAHFRQFQAATNKVVTGRQLHDGVPIRLGAKARLTTSPLVRIAKLEIDPVRLQAYEAAVSEEIDDSIRLEPGVLTIYAVSLADRRSELRFFEIYADEAAYRQHLASPHFRKYLDTTRSMISSRQLVEARPLFLHLRGQVTTPR